MPIVVCSLSRAPDVAREHKPSRAISLLDPGTPFPHFEALDDAARLRVGMHDIDQETPGRDLPQGAHLAEIIDFVSGWDRAAPLLVHCWAGISRSTATAFITACLHNPQTSEFAIAQALRAASRTATPNKRLVALADAALGRNGRMIAAAHAIGRGEFGLEFTGEAEPFVLASRF